MKSGEVKSKNSRRKFLKKTSAGVILASLPAASVWGQDALIAGSIAGSGHGSDFTGAASIALLSPGYWKNHTEQWGTVAADATYYSLTDSVPFGYYGTGTLKDSDGNTLSETQKQELTLLQILQNPGGGNGNGTIDGKYAGPGNINCYIAEMILNAENHGKTVDAQSINFPVLMDSPFLTSDQRGLFPNLKAFAKYLHNNAINNETALAAELESLLNGNHA